MPGHEHSTAGVDLDGVRQNTLRRLEHHVDLCMRLQAASSHPTFPRDLLHEVRRTAAELDDLQREQGSGPDDGDDEASGQIEALFELRDALAESIRQWLISVRPSDFDPTDPESIALWVETRLPLIWSVERDVVLVFGSDLIPALDSLQVTGHERIILVVDRGQVLPPSVVDHGIVVATRPSQLDAYLTSWCDQPPHRFAWLNGSSFAPDDVINRVEQMRTRTALVRLALDTVREHGEQIIANTIANYDTLENYPSVAHLDQAFRHRPCIIAAPGPSLNEQISTLSTLTDRAVLIAVPGSYDRLQAKGATPHIVVATDMRTSAAWSPRDPTSIPLLVTSAACSPSLVQQPAQRHAMCSSGNAIDAWPFTTINEDATLPSDGTEVGAALSLAHRLGCNPIFFVGLDPWTVPNAPTSPPRWGPPINNVAPTVLLPGYGSKTISASPQFAAFHRWLCDTIRVYGESPTLINASVGGSYVEGMAHLPLRESYGALLDHPIDFVNVIERRFDMTSHHRKRRLAEARHEQTRALVDLIRGADLMEDRARRLTEREHLLEYQQFLASYPTVVDDLKQHVLLSTIHQVKYRNLIAAVKTASETHAQTSAAVRLFSEIGKDARRLLQMLDQTTKASQSAA